jgi:hypothetical protein
MPTVQEVLRQSGFNDDEIAAMDGRAITAFSSVLSRAEQEKQDNINFYENSIVPSLTAWDEEKQRIENEKARVAAEAAFYRTQAEEARKSGFIPGDAPSFQTRDGQGRYVAGSTGSPVFEPQEVIKKAGDGLALIADVDWRHRQLFDRPLPISPSELIRQADARRQDPMTYASQAFGFTQREQELQKQQQEAHDSKIRTEAEAARDRFWAERTGSNPDVRRSGRSPEMTDIARATKAGKLPDPLLLGENERRQATRQAIRNELADG